MHNVFFIFKVSSCINNDPQNYQMKWIGEISVNSFTCVSIIGLLSTEWSWTKEQKLCLLNGDFSLFILSCQNFATVTISISMNPNKMPHCKRETKIKLFVSLTLWQSKFWWCVVSFVKNHYRIPLISLSDFFKPPPTASFCFTFRDPIPLPVFPFVILYYD